MVKNKITDLKQQQNNPHRISIYVDGKYFLGLDETDVLKEKLEIGQALSETDLERLRARSEDAKCLNSSLKLVQSRMYTARELTKKLSLKGFSEEAISYVVSELQYYGYVDDFEYARMYVEETKQKYGPMKLKQKLFEKGVPSDLIEDVLSNIDDSDTVVALLRTKMRRNAIMQEDVPKILRFLAQRGFSYDKSKKAIDTYMEEMNEDC